MKIKKFNISELNFASPLNSKFNQQAGNADEEIFSEAEESEFLEQFTGQNTASLATNPSKWKEWGQELGQQHKDQQAKQHMGDTGGKAQSKKQGNKQDEEDKMQEIVHLSHQELQELCHKAKQEGVQQGKAEANEELQHSVIKELTENITQKEEQLEFLQEQILQAVKHIDFSLENSAKEQQDKLETYSNNITEIALICAEKIIGNIATQADIKLIAEELLAKLSIIPEFSHKEARIIVAPDVAEYLNDIKNNTAEKQNINNQEENKQEGGKQESNIQKDGEQDNILKNMPLLQRAEIIGDKAKSRLDTEIKWGRNGSVKSNKNIDESDNLMLNCGIIINMEDILQKIRNMLS